MREMHHQSQIKKEINNKIHRLPCTGVRKTHNFENSSEFGAVKEVECLRPNKETQLEGTGLPKNCKFSDYYENLTGLVEFLNFEHLSIAQEFDPFWKVIRNYVKYKGEHTFKDKMFFFYIKMCYTAKKSVKASLNIR